jgi:hypothetical protein
VSNSEPPIVSDELLEDILASEQERQEREELAQESLVLGAPVSPARRDAFLSSFQRDRLRLATVENLFRRQNAFTQDPTWNDAFAFGFNVLLRKAPFVEGSSWLPYGTYEFASAVQRRLIWRLEERLRADAGDDLGETAEADELVPLGWPEILGAARAMADELETSGYVPSLVVIAGEIGSDMLVQLMDHATPPWSMPEETRGAWIIGAMDSLPILHVPDPAPPAVYVTDLGRLAHLTQHGLVPQYEIREFDEATAAEMVDAGRTPVDIPAGRQDTRDERIRQLRLRVGLRLYESFSIRPQDENAVLARQLEGAISSHGAREEASTYEGVVKTAREKVAAARAFGWTPIRLELGRHPFAAVEAEGTGGPLDIAISTSPVALDRDEGIFLIAVDDQGVAHRL